MDALDLLRMLAEADEDMEGALDALLTYKKFVQPLLTKRMQGSTTDFFCGK